MTPILTWVIIITIITTIIIAFYRVADKQNKNYLDQKWFKKWSYKYFVTKWERWRK